MSVLSISLGVTISVLIKLVATVAPAMKDFSSQVIIEHVKVNI